jgi:hypothetical protein
MERLRRWQWLFILSLVLASCGGGGGGSSGSSSSRPPVTNASPGGIWRGTESVSGLTVVGLIDESGELHFIRSDNTQYVGRVTTAGNSVTASIEGFTQFGYQFADGATHGTGSVSGSITARSSMNLNTQFQTDNGTSSSGTLNLTFDSGYNRASSLAKISGNYLDGSDTITVSSNGDIFEQDPNTGCVVNGTVSIINASYNAYRLQYSFSSCFGQAAVLNGLQFSGLGMLDNTQTPEHAIIGVTAHSGATKLAIVLNLPRT